MSQKSSLRKFCLHWWTWMRRSFPTEVDSSVVQMVILLPLKMSDWWLSSFQENRLFLSMRRKNSLFIVYLLKIDLTKVGMHQIQFQSNPNLGFDWIWQELDLDLTGFGFGFDQIWLGFDWIWLNLTRFDSDL